MRRCTSPDCPRYHLPYRPEAEGAWALPHGEYGLDVIALIGFLELFRMDSIRFAMLSLQHFQAFLISCVTFIICVKRPNQSMRRIVKTPKELKKQVRGIRPIEREVEQQENEDATITRKYCLAVRSALTDDGHPPLSAPGLKLYERLSLIVASLERVAQKGGFSLRLTNCTSCSQKA